MQIAIIGIGVACGYLCCVSSCHAQSDQLVDKLFEARPFFLQRWQTRQPVETATQWPLMVPQLAISDLLYLAGTLEAAPESRDEWFCCLKSCN